MSIKKDIEYGLNKELEILDLLKNKFGESITKTKDKYSSFDFEGDNIKIELKSRRNTSDLYPTTMIGYRKIQAAKYNKRIQHYYVFQFIDKVLYCQYNESDFKTFEIKRSGRIDRGRIESDDYIYIPIKYLIELNI